jgi:pilus assembly protein CpaF
MNRSESSKIEEFENIKRRIHQRLVDRIDLSRVGDLKGESFRREIRLVVEHLCDSENSYLNRSDRDRVVE